MNKQLRVLVVEDSDPDYILLVRLLQKSGGYEVQSQRVETPDGMRTALKNSTWDIILSDYKMPQFNAILALNVLRETGLDIPFIIVSGSIGEETAVAAMKAGSHDYVMKDHLARLIPAIDRELRDAQVRASHRAAEERLRVTERLGAIGEVAASIIHDLKTPLQAVMTATEVLAEENLSSEQRAEHCQTISQQVLRMVSLTQQVLEFAKGEIRISASMIDLVRLCGDTVNAFRETLSGSSISIDFSYQPTNGVSSSVILDGDKIWRVLTNLLNNSRDAMPYGGEIHVRLVMNRDQIRIEVEDTGHGIPEMIRERIFEPFVSEGRIKGTGLGLAIVKQIVQAHGGTVTFQTAEGKGTTFIVTLPRVALKSVNHTAIDVVHALQG